MSVLLDVRHLRVNFATAEGLARAVDDVSFTVEAGESVALLGESGSGKTVTALSIMRLLGAAAQVAASSAVVFEGRDLFALDAAAMRRVRGARIGMVFADTLGTLNPVLTVGAQIAEAIRAHERLSHSAALARAVALLDRTGLPSPATTAHRYPHELSGGQRQRAGLAIAVASRPALLIADEPTSALDVTTQAQVLELLTQLRSEFGMALLLITHDLGVVRVAASRALVMYAGEIVEESPVDALVTTPTHPYTRALLGAWPRLGDARRALRPIPGMVPSATAWPAGCRFRERCSRAWDLCATDAPALAPVDAVRRARCHLVTHPPA